MRIKEIKATEVNVLVSRLVAALDEHQAIRLEAELIAAIGTVDTGGRLMNTVVPSGVLN